MQFTLTNFGRIRKADIALNGITVIAGPNGSGKSTISRALFTWYNFLRQVGGEIPRVRIQSIGEEVGTVLKEQGVPEDRASRFLRTFFRNRPPVKLANRSFWLDQQASRHWWQDHCSSYLLHFSYSEDDLSRINRMYDVLRERALYWIDADVAKVAQFVLEKYFLRAFDGQIGTYFDDHADSTVALSNDAGAEQSCLFFGGKVRELHDIHTTNGDAYGGMQAFYLEPRHLLDEVPTESGPRMKRTDDNRYSTEQDLSWGSILTKDLKRKDMSFSQVERLDPINEELDKIVATVHGEIDRDETKLVFKDADLPHDKAVSLLNIASGVKSIAAIVRGLRNDSIHPGDFLIIDEPESNLHPEWQLSFAKFLVLLRARFDMRILINTHSPYFLKAIEVYSDEYEQGEDCEYYNMVKFSNGQYDTQCVTECRQDVFKAMSAPFSRLMRGEHYERSLS